MSLLNKFPTNGQDFRRYALMYGKIITDLSYVVDDANYRDYTIMVNFQTVFIKMKNGHVIDFGIIIRIGE